MKISKNFLSDYINLNCDVEELCKKLTCAGIEVEEVEQSEIVPKGIVVGKILSREPHPNADTLSVCKVFDGEKELQIVCGAPNCDVGKTVPVATIGTVFKDGEGEFLIKKAKLRGIESNGMMCSAKELGVGEDDHGLWELDNNLVAGTSMNEVLGADTCITVEVTPNRSDWLSHYGIARDVACIINSESKLPKISLPEAKIDGDYTNLVTVLDQELCPRYSARVIKNVKVQESPKWLQDRLTAIGLRPINNIVDISNFVLMELGQPLHVFDMGKLSGQRVVIRRANDGEKLELLNGQIVELKNRHLVIADAEKPVVLAGVMGGEDSGVSASTTNILVESAVFFSSNIRSSSRELGISSDSSYRYERGVDFDMVRTASERACQLILELAGGTLVSDFIDKSIPRPAEKIIPCRFEKIKSLLGIEITNERIVEIFEKLQLKVKDITATSCVVEAPLFRLDLSNEADLAEEVARINGLDNIPVIPVIGKMCASSSKDSYYKYQKLREDLIALGLFECYHYSTVSDKSALSDSRFTLTDIIKIKNPLSGDLASLRPSLFGEMLNTVERNISRRNLDLQLFELGKVFCGNQALYPEERMEICLMLTGAKHPERFSGELKEFYDFYDTKGAITSLMEIRKVTNYRFNKSNDSRFEPNACAELIINGKSAGFVGELNKKLVKSFKTNRKIFGAVLDVEIILGGTRPKLEYKPFSMFPSTSRDVAFSCDNTLEHATVLDFIKKCKLDNLEKIELFDIFVDEKLGNNKKSMAYKLTFRNLERTLTDDEVNKTFDKLRASLANDLKVELR